jgi:FHS family L-fucose permease-like MFS transporter
MMQAFNSFGTFLAPLMGSFFILRGVKTATDTSAIRYPYLIIACVLVIIGVILSRIKFPEKSKNCFKGTSWSWVLKDSSLILGVMGIFAYVGAEVAIGSFLVNYVMTMMPMPATEAAALVSFYWGGAMIGRFLGIFTLKIFSPGRVLTVHAMLAIAFILISINSKDLISVYSMILVGLCNSIMFPTIFTLSINHLAESETQKASGILSTAIFGGALIPLVTGELIDKVGFRVAFFLPIFCYGYIAFLGIRSHNPLTDIK